MGVIYRYLLYCRHCCVSIDVVKYGDIADFFARNCDDATMLINTVWVLV